MYTNNQNSNAQGELSPEAKSLFVELGVEQPTVPPLPPELEAAGAGLSPDQRTSLAVTDLARRTALFSMIDIAVFFAVLLVGFAYVWKRGDLDWVRALSKQRALESRAGPASPVIEEEAVMAP
jgi:NADH-quinone oxidoreductase subunit A